MKNVKSPICILILFFASGFSFEDKHGNSDSKNISAVTEIEYCYQVRGECGTSTVGTACGYIINGQCVPF